MLLLSEQIVQSPYCLLSEKNLQMPRKSSGTTQPKANAKGAIVSSADDFGGPIISSPNSEVPTGTPHARGAAPTRGVKRRRTSNKANSTSGADMYNSGTIIATNPFDDDNHVPVPNHTISNITNNNSKMMIMSPSQPNYQHHPGHHHHHHHHHGPPPVPMHLHQPPQQQQMMHHQHHHQQQMYAPQHTHVPLMHQNNQHSQHQYQMPQQTMNMGPPAPHHVGTPPGHMPMSHPAPHQQHQPMHPEHLGPPQDPSSMHNQMMSNQQHHQSYSLPPPQHHQAQQQQTQMIGTATPPHGLPVSDPSNSPYNTMQQHQMVPPHQTMTPPQQPAPQQQQPPPTHNMDPMQMQQTPSYNNNAYCGKCQLEVYHHEPNIICKAGCKSLFHISCSGLSKLACDLLMKESLAEWACDRCASGARRVPYIKYKS